MEAKDRVPTGIQGLDELIEGGLPRGFTYSVVGGPGAGKTIFGCQFLYKGAAVYGDSGIYVTLEEPTYSVANNMLRFNWDLYSLEQKSKFAFVDASPIQGEIPGKYVLRSGFLGTEKFDVAGVLALINEAKKHIKAKRCVVDSLSGLLLQFKDQFETRQQAFRLVKGLTEMGLTTLLLAEKSEEAKDTQKFGIESFLPQGVITLHQFRVEDSILRALEVRKMRGVKQMEKLVLYRIGQDGIEVFPNETVFGTR